MYPRLFAVHAGWTFRRLAGSWRRVIRPKDEIEKRQLQDFYDTNRGSIEMIDSQVLAFTAIAAILTITPGADTLLVMRSVLARGQRAGLLTTFGIGLGLFIHA